MPASGNSADPVATAAAGELLRRFSRQRPLRAGSLIVTLFGDAVMPRGGAISLGSLIGLAAPFGLSERLVRTATARLAKDGWLDGRRSGKLSEYELSRHGRERFAEATLRIYSPPESPWVGRWTLVVLPPMPAQVRHVLRKELAWRGFGEISGNVFAHPEASAEAHAALTADLTSQVLVFDARLSAEDDPQRLASLGWDLADLARRYTRFVAHFQRVVQDVRRRGPIDQAAAFIVRTLLIHEYRRLHLRDPMLPPRLLPADWPGTLAASLSREIYSRVFEASERHLSQIAATLQGPLPPPDGSILERFGGLSVA